MYLKQYFLEIIASIIFRISLINYLSINPNLVCAIIPGTISTAFAVVNRINTKHKEQETIKLIASLARLEKMIQLIINDKE